MAHPNSNVSDINVEHVAGIHATGRTNGEEMLVSKPADMIYRIAAMVGALILLFTVVWAG